MFAFLRTRSIAVLLISFAAAFTVGGCGLSLAEDVTPPPNYRPPAVVTPQPVEVSTVFPLVPPDPAQGAAVYTEKCMPCHGVTGMGDGPQSGNLSNPAPPIGSAVLARQRKPAEWFQIVTRGNLERLMPGFSQSLTDRQRWDVVAYVYTLSATASELEQGQALYEQNCASCHGTGGYGDGAQAASLNTRPASWKEQSQLSQMSANDISDVIAQGAGEMPAFADRLDQNQRLAVASYIRKLSFSSPGDAPAASDPNPANPTQASTEAASIEQITISGTITNRSAGGVVPGGLEVVLLAYQGMQPAFERTTTADENGAYRFDNVDFSPDYVYITRVDVDQMSYNSDILHGSGVAETQVDLPLEIYNVSTDASVLTADRLHVFFDFSQPNKVQVVELFIITNPTDAVVAAGGPNDPVIAFELPEGAQNLQFEDGALGGRYIATSNGFGDLASVVPGMGQHQVLFAYELPYDRKLDLALKAPLPVQAAIVMLPQDNVTLKSAQLTDAGARSVQGMSFQMFQAATSLAAGDSIQINLSGRPVISGASSNTNNLIPVLLGAGIFLMVLGGVLYWVMRQRSMQPALADGPTGGIDEEESSEALLDAILALDDLYQSGQLPEPAYQERRAALKARLAAAVQQENQ